MAFGQSVWVLVIFLVIAVVFVMVKGNPKPSATASCSCQPGTLALEDQVDKIRSVKKNVKDILHQYKLKIGNRTYSSYLHKPQEVLRLSEAGSVSLADTRSNCLLNIVQIIDSIRNIRTLRQSFGGQLNSIIRMTCDACNRLTSIECISTNVANGRVQATVVRKLRDVYIVTCEMERRVNPSASECTISDLY